MQYDRHKEARNIFKKIDSNPGNYLIIHYSCESFYEIKDGNTPRITSIAVYNYASGQTDSFSIHKMAEKSHIDNADIEKHYDQLEKQMLEEFFTYAKNHTNYYWIHWNMRDENYGFRAIEHRFSILDGDPYIISDDRKIDLARELINCYGVGYIGHPRMQKLLEKNKVKAKDFLGGKQEAEAFSNHEYLKLHRSTLRKVDVIANILTRAINNTLKVNSKWAEIYGISIQGIANYCKDTWWIQIIWSFVLLIIGGFIGALIGKII